MDLVQENPVRDNREKKLKITLGIVLTLIFILIVAAVVIYFYAQNVEKSQLKISIDGIVKKQLNKESLSESIVSDNSEDFLISVKNIANELGYKYYDGGYKEYTQDTTSGYVDNSLEIASFSANSNKIVKYSDLDKDANPQTFTTDNSIEYKAGTIFADFVGLERIFNLQIKYDKSKNLISISSLPYLVKQVEAGNSKAYYESETDKRIQFNNEKAILSNLYVVKDESSGLIGVDTAKDNSYVKLLDAKYKSVEYNELTENFKVTTTDGKYGIIGKDASVKVTPAYSNIVEIDEKAGLYLVDNGNSQEVINNKGKIIVYPQYKQIGLSDTYDDLNVTNKYLLFDELIPVLNLENKWGFINKSGEQVIDFLFDGVGCARSSQRVGTKGLIIIPEMEAIILEVDSNVGNLKTKKYGIVDKTGQQLTEFTADYAYSSTVKNETTYYISIQEQPYDILALWNQSKNAATSSTNTTKNSNTTSNSNVQSNNKVQEETEENEQSEETEESEPSVRLVD